MSLPDFPTFLSHSHILSSFFFVSFIFFFHSFFHLFSIFSSFFLHLFFLPFFLSLPHRSNPFSCRILAWSIGSAGIHDDSAVKWVNHKTNFSSCLIKEWDYYWWGSSFKADFGQSRWGPGNLIWIPHGRFKAWVVV